MSNILIISHRSGPYHYARINMLKTRDEIASIVSADLGSGGDIYRWKSENKSDHYFLSKRGATENDIFTRINRLIRILRSNDIDTVFLPGFGSRDLALICIILRLLNYRIFTFYESWYPNVYLDRLKSIFLRSVFTGFFVSGSRAKAYLVNLGISDFKIIEGYSCIDVSHFNHVRSKEVVTALSHSPVLLCVARLSDEKNLKRLITAFKMSELSVNWRLQIIGSGPSELVLKQLAANEERVEILEWIQYDTLPNYYQKASAFILPSVFEPWGLVVNEAMASSLPILVSRMCGCCPDLLKENGMDFDPFSIDAIKNALNSLNAKSPVDLYHLGLRSREIIGYFTLNVWADNMVKILEIDEANIC